MGNYNGRTPVVVFDIDGTLANIEHRRHFVDGTHGRKDFNAFYDAMVYDKAIPEMLGIHNMYFMNNWTLIYCTGRPEQYRTATRDWLDRFGFFGAKTNTLLMRPTGERYRPDYEVKQEMHDYISADCNIHIVFDDRQQVVDMWRRNGCFVCQVADGNF